MENKIPMQFNDYQFLDLVTMCHPVHNQRECTMAALTLVVRCGNCFVASHIYALMVYQWPMLQMEHVWNDKVSIYNTNFAKNPATCYYAFVRWEGSCTQELVAFLWIYHT